jgi:helicase
MRVSDLAKFGLPSQVLELWQARQGDTLLPVQVRAVRQGLLGSMDGCGNPRSLVISAPTSAGKSFCAEMAALKVLTSRQKAVILLPLKSLAEEKHALFEQTYGVLGLRCLLVTGDHPENDRPFAEGAYNIAVAIYEKFDLLLVNRLDVLRNIGLIVVDEIQTIAEPGRGAVLERLLLKVLASRYQPSLVALSAALAENAAEPLATWLGADLVDETSRPRDLIRGIAADGRLRYRSYNGGHDGTEQFEALRGEPEDDFCSRVTARLLVDKIRSEDGSALVFLKSRADTINLALCLAARVAWPPADKALAQLADEESSSLVQTLTQVLRHGVAFHNSDLSASQRRIVEQAFREGEVRTICSTTTLALGVNLPADNVYLETVKYSSAVYGGPPELVPITRAEFDNMSGRAGRLGVGSERPGRAVVLAESAFDQQVLWDNYIAPVSGAAISSAFDSLSPEDWILHLLAARVAENRLQLQEVLRKSLRAALDQTWQCPLAEPLRILADVGLVRTDDEEGRLVITPLGCAVAKSGLTITQARRYLQLLDHRHPESRIGWIALALGCPDWVIPPGFLSHYEHANRLPLKELYRRLDHRIEEVSQMLPENHRTEALSYRAAAALKASLLLEQWCELESVAHLEEQYHIHLGQIQTLGQAVSHLLRAVAMLIRAGDTASESPGLLDAHAFSVRCGLPPEMQRMHERLSRALQRSDFVVIRNHGVESLEELCELPDEELGKMFTSRDKHNRVMQLLATIREEDEMQPATQTRSLAVISQPRSIDIDGSCESDRYLVRIDGYSVRLTGKSFKYLVKLAWSRLTRDAGWIYKEDIEVGFNQARYLYRMKNEIAAGFSSSWPIIENNRLGYYRLKIDPDRIRINEESIRRHPDHEIRSMLEQRPVAVSVN